MQPDAQPGTLAAGFVEAAAQAAAHFAGEHAVEQVRAEGFRRDHLGRFDAADGVPCATEPQEEILDFKVRKRSAKLRRGLTAWRVEDARRVAVAERLDRQVEVEVFHVAHSEASFGFRGAVSSDVFE